MSAIDLTLTVLNLNDASPADVVAVLDGRGFATDWIGADARRSHEAGREYGPTEARVRAGQQWVARAEDGGAGYVAEALDVLGVDYLIEWGPFGDDDMPHWIRSEGGEVTSSAQQAEAAARLLSALREAGLTVDEAVARLLSGP